MSLTFFFIYKTKCVLCVARALVMVCQVCKEWVVGNWWQRPQLLPDGRVMLFNRCGLLRSRTLRPHHFPVWGLVDFWEQSEVWVLLCSEECYHELIQDPEEAILKSQVNMFL